MMVPFQCHQWMNSSNHFALPWGSDTFVIFLMFIHVFYLCCCCLFVVVFFNTSTWDHWTHWRNFVKWVEAINHAIVCFVAPAYFSGIVPQGPVNDHTSNPSPQHAPCMSCMSFSKKCTDIVWPSIWRTIEEPDNLALQVIHMEVENNLFVEQQHEKHDLPRPFYSTSICLLLGRSVALEYWDHRGFLCGWSAVSLRWHWPSCAFLGHRGRWGFHNRNGLGGAVLVVGKQTLERPGRSGRWTSKTRESWNWDELKITGHAVSAVGSVGFLKEKWSGSFDSGFASPRWVVLPHRASTVNCLLSERQCSKCHTEHIYICIFFHPPMIYLFLVFSSSTFHTLF